MNLLVVHEAGYIEAVIYEYQIISEILSSNGHRVYVIDYSSTKKGLTFSEIFSLKTKYFYNVGKTGRKKGVTLIRPGIIKIFGLGRLSAFISHFFAIRKVIKKHKIDRIILYSIMTNALQTIFWAKIYKIPVLFRLMDVIHQLVSFPYKLLKWPIYLTERVVYKSVDQLLAVTPRIAKYAIKMGANPKTTTYLPTSAVDSKLFYPNKKDPKLLKKYGLSKKDLVILFAGYLYRFSGLDEVIIKLPKYLKKYPHMKLVIVGPGEQENQLHQLINQYKLSERVVLTGFVNFEDLPNYINLADVCINPFHIIPATNIIFPGKIYQYTACGKPTLATKLQGMTDIFPVDTSDKHGIYYYDTIEEFFHLIPKVYGKNIKDPNPSIQEITKVMEKKLESMKI